MRIAAGPVAAGPVDRQASAALSVETDGRGLVEITRACADFVTESGIAEGLFTAFCRHTSASLAIQENADPEVRLDLLAALDRLAPEAGPWVHDSEGPDDMPAHVKAMLTGASLSVPVRGGRLALGTWQGLYLVEHRARPHRREVILTAVGMRR